MQLVSAQRGYGVPARWVRTCICPPGYKGEFCEQCSANFRRLKPTEGAFSSCVPCSCRGGSCDPQTGDCYSADEDTGELSCPHDFYHDPWKPRACVKCPCPDGVSCSLGAGSLQPQCDRCPHGTAGRSQGCTLATTLILEVNVFTLMYFLERHAKMTITKMQIESMQTYVID